jgi:DNA-binding response OmpR family regulator
MSTARMECIAKEQFDLALLDLRMKGIGGMEVLAAFRQQSPDTAVIVLTAHGSLETAVEALRKGAHDYLFKPCKTAELRESVRTGLRKRQREVRQRELLDLLERSLSGHVEEIRAAAAEQPTAPPPAVTELAEEEGRFLRHGGLIADLMRHVITLDGHLLELSSTEFGLLAYLIGEAPRVVSPQELVREVQEYESESWEASDTIRSHIYHIRQKMEAAAGRSDVIRTARGAGYAIDE